jgi:hypothetical protein
VVHISISRVQFLSASYVVDPVGRYILSFPHCVVLLPFSFFLVILSHHWMAWNMARLLCGVHLRFIRGRGHIFKAYSGDSPSRVSFLLETPVWAAKVRSRTGLFLVASFCLLYTASHCVLLIGDATWIKEYCIVARTGSF